MDTKDMVNESNEEIESPSEGQERTDKEVEKEPQQYWEKILKNIENNEEDRSIVNYYRIENHGIITGDDAQFEDIFLGRQQTKKKSMNSIHTIVDDDKSLSAWIAEVYETSDFAFMVSCAVFECFPCHWVQEAADKLYEACSLSKNENQKVVGRGDIIAKLGAEIYLDQIKTYTGKTSVEFVQFQKNTYQKTILQCIWKEFPQTRQSVILWLRNYILKGHESMSKRAVDILSYLACLDYYYFLNQMIPQIYQGRDISDDLILTQIILYLHSDEEHKDNICRLLHNWSKQNNVHYLLVVCLVGAERKEFITDLESAIHIYLQKLCESISTETESEYIKQLFCFFASGMRSFMFYRILIEEMYDLLCSDFSIVNKRNVGVLFLMLFSVDLSLVNFKGRKCEDSIFISLCYVKHEIQGQLCILWQTVAQSSKNRKEFYILLGKYMSLLQKSDREEAISSFINKVFETDTPEKRKDIAAKIYVEYRRMKSE